MSDPLPPNNPETPSGDNSGGSVDGDKLNLAPRDLTRKLRLLADYERKSPIKLTRTSPLEIPGDGAAPKPRPLPDPAIQLPQSDSRPAVRPDLVTPPHKRVPVNAMETLGRIGPNPPPTPGKAVEYSRDRPSIFLSRPVLIGLLFFSVAAGLIGTFLFVRAFSPNQKTVVGHVERTEDHATLPAMSPTPSVAAKPENPSPPPPDSNPVVTKYLVRIDELSGKGDVRALERLFNQTLEERSRDPRYWLTMAATWTRVFSKAGKSGQQIAGQLGPFYKNALQYAPNDPLVLEQTGGHAMEAGRIEEALEYFRRARTADPQSASIRRQLLFALMAHNDRKEAMAIAREWVLEQPADVELRRILATLYTQENDLGRAVDHQLILVRLNPFSVPDATQLIMLLQQAGRSAEIPAIFRDLTKDPSTNPNMIYMLAVAELSGNNHAEAVAAFQRFRDRAPKDVKLTANFHTQLAAALAGAGDIAAAEKSYRTALAQDPEFPDACNNLAYLLVDTQGALDEADRLATKALESRPDHPPYLDTKGRILLASGRTAEAVAVLGQAADLSEPPDADIFLHLGDAHSALGQKDKARAAWTRAQEINPNHAASAARLSVPKDPAP